MVYIGWSSSCNQSWHFFRCMHCQLFLMKMVGQHLDRHAQYLPSLHSEIMEIVTIGVSDNVLQHCCKLWLAGRLQIDWDRENPIMSELIASMGVNNSSKLVFGTFDWQSILTTSYPTKACYVRTCQVLYYPQRVWSPLHLYLDIFVAVTSNEFFDLM